MSVSVKLSVCGVIEQIVKVLVLIGVVYDFNKFGGGGLDLLQMYVKGMVVFLFIQDGIYYFDWYYMLEDMLDKIDFIDLVQNVVVYVVYVYMVVQVKGDFGLVFGVFFGEQGE